MPLLQNRHGNSQEDWVAGVKRFENLNASQISALEDCQRIAQERVRDLLAVYGKALVFWSGGKDSQVLRRVIENAGISLPSVCIQNHPDMNFPAIQEWIEKHSPSGCRLVFLKENLEWFARNEELVFPGHRPQDTPKSTARLRLKWDEFVWKEERRQAEQGGFKLQIMGRRRADGNVVGRDGILVANGLVTLSPLWDWKHETVLAYLSWQKLPLPPCYLGKTWENDWTGPYAWAQTSALNPPEKNGMPYERVPLNELWEEVFRHDPSIVKTATRYFRSARDFYGTMGKTSI